MFQDPIALHKFEELNERYGFKTVVETGTFHAESTLIFSYYVPLVLSVDNSRECFDISSAAVYSKGYKTAYDTDTCRVFQKGERTISLYHADSARWMPTILNTVKKPACFFLDAHWGENWPILGELDALEGMGESTIIIHDFKVPDRDFRFDKYKGQELNTDYVRERLMKVNPEFKIEYNKEAAGCYCGILYALPEVKWIYF